MTIRRTFFLAALVFAGYLSLPASMLAVSPAGRVAEGNKAYQEGRFDDALAAYEQASESLPDNAVVMFNKGAALYKKGDYKAAEESFRESAELSDDLELKARAFYNSGNSAFKQGEPLLGDNLDDALKFCEKSENAYRKSVELDRDFPPAVENLEIARLTIRAIRDEMQAREEERQRQEELQQEMMERMQEIMEQQQDLRDQTEQAAGEDQEKPETGDQQDENKSQEKTGQRMADQQSSLKDDTKQTAEDAEKAGAQEQLSDHLEAASKHQEQAEAKLKEEKFEEALPDQEKALEELKQALESAMRERDQKKSGEQDKAEQQEEAGDPDENDEADDKGEESEKQDAMEQREPEPPEDPEEGDETFDQDARDIIDREKQSRAERLREGRIRFEPVERDW